MKRFIEPKDAMANPKPLNPLYDPATDNQKIDPATQSMLNKPMAYSSGLTPEEQALLDLIKQKVEEGRIQLYSPSSLLNTAVYDALPPAAKGKADQNAVLFIGKIRQILDLEKISREPTYQLKQLISDLNQSKKRLEEHGDLFII